MSYILDALRRADSERDRGAVPGVHARQLPLAGGDGDAPSARLPGWLWPVAAVGVLVIGALVWMLLGRDPPRDVAAVTPIAASVPLPAPLPSPASLPTSPPVDRVVPAPRPPVAVAAVAAVKPPARALPAAPPAAPVDRPGAAPEPKASAPEVRIYTVADLPDEVRRDLPNLAIGGAMYSENPANRMLIINGQTFHERDRLAPGLLLVQIKLKSAVLEFKGWRYGISY